jgi:valyl-tRNA synthetase
MTDTTKNEMAKAYDPKEVESQWYDWWDSEGYFTPQISRDKEPYTIIMPPPNVTGELHMGHALTNAVEDILIRFKRMQGYNALYLPGEDHAGIAGQWVVEKEIAKEGLTRHDLGRDGFLDRAWEWMNLYRPRIRNQLRRLGASCDWTRECFTMDAGPALAVRTVFKHLYDKGLIYKGERIVNWCPRCATTLSDLEVDMVEETSSLWTIRYPQEGDPSGGIEVSTTRPETMLADTGVGVHPSDKRWAHLVGKNVILPIMDRPIPVVADEGVDPEFGTGAVKLTPGHDPLDFEIGQRQGLPTINLLNLDGTLNENAGPYAGQGAEEARKGVAEQLERDGFLVKVDPYTHNVPRCDRCNSVIEPIVSDQWFVSMKPLAEPAIQAVRDGRVRIVPERFAKVYFHWMENVRDWPISRQLWWGHRIPVWYCANGHEFSSADEPANVTRCTECGSEEIRQDSDVLDTWFSSGLWPFSTLGWPNETPDLDYFYPGDVMETGYDILFLWVARMIFQGLENMDEIPFHTVYLHGMVRDDKGQKMSKTKGNVVDPLVMVERYGSDALRLSLITNSSPGNDQRFSPQRTEQAGHFANKLWNATRFVLAQGEASATGTGEPTRQPATSSLTTDNRLLANRWILSRYNRTVREVTRMLDEYQLGEAGKLLQEFVWSDYCDWYIEASKGAFRSDDHALREETLRTARGVLDGTLRLLHPYMPFLTEELWQHLHGWPCRDEARGKEEQSIMLAAWPEAGAEDEEAERNFNLLIETIREVRNARAEAMRDAPENQRRELTGRRIEALIAGGERTPLIQREAETLASLARLDPQKLTIAESLSPEQRPERATTLVIGDGEVEVVLPMAGLVDLDAERKRLQSEAEAAEAEVTRLEAMLANTEFTEKAPAPVVDRIRTSHATAQERLAKLRERLGAL